MNGTINPEFSELRQDLNNQGKLIAEQGKEIAELRGNVQQLDKLAATANRQSTLQIAAIVITICLTIAGGLYFQTNSINRNVEQLEKRMERVERNLDELNKESRAQRQEKEVREQQKK